MSKAKALETYEEIVRGRIDPALLEYAGGNTFSGRVFPIPAKGYNRVIIAYEELLPATTPVADAPGSAKAPVADAPGSAKAPVADAPGSARVFYRYPLPDCKLNELQFTLVARSAECKESVFVPKDAGREEGGGQLVYSKTWTDKGPGGAVQFAFTPPRPEMQAISSRQGDSGPVYTYARIRPELKVEAAKPFAKNAVFLLDTSLSEHPDRFAINMKLLRQILEADPGIEQFNILAFNVGASWVEPKAWLPNTKAGRDKAFARLDGIVLEGATDLSAALDKLVAVRTEVAKTHPTGMPLNVFLLSDGQITWGESDVNTLVARFEAGCPFSTRIHCYRTGLGAENLELFDALVRKGGGIFNCFTEADLAAAAKAHRTQCLQVEQVRFVGGPAVSDVLVAGRKAAVYPGGELIVAAKVSGTGKSNIIVEGTFLGERVVQEYPVEITATGELAPRGWAEIAVASLLALNDSKLDSLVTAYCQQFGIGSRVASFLVLENDADYKRLNLEAERGKTVNGDLGQFLEIMWQTLGKAVAPRHAFLRFLEQVNPRVQVLNSANGANVGKLLAILTDKEFEMPACQARRGDHAQGGCAAHLPDRA